VHPVSGLRAGWGVGGVGEGADQGACNSRNRTTRLSAYFVSDQTEKDLRLRAQGFSGVDVDLVDGRWALWSAGCIVGRLEPDQGDLLMGLRPLLRTIADTAGGNAGCRGLSVRAWTERPPEERPHRVREDWRWCPATAARRVPPVRC
jgi:hypothetical protein